MNAQGKGTIHVNGVKLDLAGLRGGPIESLSAALVDGRNIRGHRGGTGLVEFAGSLTLDYSPTDYQRRAVASFAAGARRGKASKHKRQSVSILFYQKRRKLPGGQAKTRRLQKKREKFIDEEIRRYRVELENAFAGGFLT